MNHKFKLWDNKNKLWMNPSLLQVGADGNLLPRIYIEDPIILRSTNAFDINNQEIFEGDIIKHLICRYEEKLSVVSFNNNGWCHGKVFYYARVELNNKIDVMWEKRGLAAFLEGWYRGDESIYDLFKHQYAEVIGNIYDNPELL